MGRRRYEPLARRDGANPGSAVAPSFVEREGSPRMLFVISPIALPYVSLWYGDALRRTSPLYVSADSILDAVHRSYESHPAAGGAGFLVPSCKRFGDGCRQPGLKGTGRGDVARYVDLRPGHSPSHRLASPVWCKLDRRCRGRGRRNGVKGPKWSFCSACAGVDFSRSAARALHATAAEKILPRQIWLGHRFSTHEPSERR